MTFGAFISTRRKEAKLNLRDTAKHLGISNGYLCDIEQGRRPAPEGAFVERISSFLELDKQEHEMLLDLAADSRQTVPADLPDYIRQHDIVRAALRVAKEVDATDEEWKAFMEMFLVVIQLGAILAVCVIYFHKLNPFSPKKSAREKRETFDIWGKVIVGCLPAAVIGLAFNDKIDALFYNAQTVAFTLIL